MARTYILQDGQPVPCENRLRWVTWLTDFWSRVLANEFVAGYEVTTLFVGVDLAPRPGRPPMLWETEVRAGSGTPMVEWTRAYASEEDALVGHAEVVDEVSRERGNC